VLRKKCEKDKRIFYVCLTERGKKFVSDIFPKHKTFLDELLNGLENDSKKELISNLIALGEALK